MSCTNTLTNKNPDAKVVITFDFSTALGSGETLSAIVTRNVSVIGGVDADPTLMWNGVAAVNISGLSVQQPVQGGLDGCYYQFEMVCDTTQARRLTVTCVLPVKAYS